MKILKNTSLSIKLILTFLLTGLAIVAVMHLSTGNNFKEFFRDSIRPHLHQYFYYINKEIGTPPNLEKAKELSESLNIKIIITGPDTLWSSDGKFLPPKHLKFRPHKHPKGKYDSAFYHGRFVIRIDQSSYRTVFVTRKGSQLPSPWKLLLRTLLGILLILSLLYLLIRWMISPLKTMQEGIKRIGSGDLEHRLTVKHKDELGNLSNEINLMADDIQNMLEAKRQLLLAISHELRSPLTRAKVALSLMENGTLKEGLQKDLEEMELMISELLEAERLNHRHQVLQLKKVNAAQLVDEVIEKYFHRDESDKPIIQFSSQPEIANELHRLNIDEARMQFVVKNLISNALKHRKTKQDSISVKCQIDENRSQYQITVTDQGKGIPEEHIPYLTEPFYRVDPSRQRETGGYGLGLYIINMIVEAHNGSLEITSVVDEGTSVTIQLPITRHEPATDV